MSVSSSSRGFPGQDLMNPIFHELERISASCEAKGEYAERDKQDWETETLKAQQILRGLSESGEWIQLPRERELRERQLQIIQDRLTLLNTSFHDEYRLRAEQQFSNLREKLEFDTVVREGLWDKIPGHLEALWKKNTYESTAILFEYCVSDVWLRCQEMLQQLQRYEETIVRLKEQSASCPKVLRSRLDLLSKSSSLLEFSEEWLACYKTVKYVQGKGWLAENTVNETLDPLIQISRNVATIQNRSCNWLEGKLRRFEPLTKGLGSDRDLRDFLACSEEVLSNNREIIRLRLGFSSNEMDLLAIHFRNWNDVSLPKEYREGMRPVVMKALAVHLSSVVLVLGKDSLLSYSPNGSEPTDKLVILYENPSSGLLCKLEDKVVWNIRNAR